MKVYSQEVARVLGRGDWKKGSIALKVQPKKIELDTIKPKFPDADLSKNTEPEKKKK